MCIFFNYNSGLGLRKSRVYIIYNLSKFDLSTHDVLFIIERMKLLHALQDVYGDFVGMFGLLSSWRDFLDGKSWM